MRSGAGGRGALNAADRGGLFCLMGALKLFIIKGKPTIRMLMKSGNPHAADQLALIISQKQNTPSRTCEIVSEAAVWLKAELTGAGVKYLYGACEENEHYGYANFLLNRHYEGIPIMMEIKIAEIENKPFVFADVRSSGRHSGMGFPFFSSLAPESGQELFLHYLSDFILSTSE